MKPEWRRYAPIGLYVSLLATLVSAGLYIFTRQFQWPLYVSMSLIVLGLLAYIVLDPKQVKTIMSGRQVRYGSNTLLMLLAIVVILVVINIIVTKNSQQWDLTADKQNTLAKETIEVLQKLPEEVTVQAFYTSRRSTESTSSLLDQYKLKSNGKFEYKFIDPEVKLAEAQQEGITQDGTLVIKMGTRREKVTSASEQEITSALVRLMNPDKKTVYFLTGHGEHSPETTGNDSISQLIGSLTDKNYAVQTLNLLTTNAVPADAALVIVAGPRKPLAQGEVNLLAEFSAKGGPLIVLEDPVLVTDFGDAADPLAAYLSDTWGVTLGNDIIIDLVGQQLLGQPFVAVGVDYATHKITEKLAGLATYFPNARSVSIRGEIVGFSYHKLVMTAPQSWAETDLDGLMAGEEPQADQQTDIVGSVPVVIAVENPTKSRLVVFGNANFITNNSLAAGGNTDLIVNAVDWSIKQEELISLTPKQTIERVMVPVASYTVPLLFIGSLCVLPFGVVVIGIVVLIVRRRRS